MEQRERHRLRFARLERHNRIWLILRYFVTHEDLCNSQSFYEYRENLAEYQNAKKELDTSELTSSDFDIAFRFCDIKFKKGECERRITLQEKQIIYSGKEDDVNMANIIGGVIISYKEYWDEVLGSYKKESERKKRICYLVERLGEYKDWPELQGYPELVEKIVDLQKYYSGLIIK